MISANSYNLITVMEYATWLHDDLHDWPILVVFRQKLSSALSIRGYFVVDNFQQSDYFLLINFDSNNKKQPIKNYVEDWISLKFLLIESKQIFSHSKLQFDRKDSIWVCRMELGALEFFKYQDNIADIVSKTICKSYSGKKIIL